MMGCDRVANVSIKFMYEGGADDVQGDDDQERGVRASRPGKGICWGSGTYDETEREPRVALDYTRVPGATPPAWEGDAFIARSLLTKGLFTTDEEEKHGTEAALWRRGLTRSRCAYSMGCSQLRLYRTARGRGFKECGRKATDGLTGNFGFAI